ncbi:S-adenosylmethionine--tRNA ribosyltransferase-isomerase [Desulfatibacillum alkenivorans DSM 16219]|jgi:S-adenosylmethionine:tRNA ribosyltransferase-isomerase|uniref:S-adenosylmethionine:tRNA ribosyltransferase-isomerase n=1 Tax=Desulfatibacillum alkenivorans DSM 16219 TaxID=1121393 RepID=A0A1M6HVJ8_9BACT|nr:tRNA preQ1(34) S-adenosylmethionine ribosyltransferase-isomerase QueA [Desulfatibacillum alkenivorans]SHJ26138.1 S-adenosylmethionine--tRNA ribosyltransferase-isomerase [Desulfatibacillum alkenivorans DSM 16219]
MTEPTQDFYSLASYDYELPEELIAQAPAEKRDASRLLRLDKNTGQTAHLQFAQAADLLQPGDLMVVNDTKVTPVRLFGKKETGGKVEALIIDYRPVAQAGPGEPFACECLVKASKRPKPGSRLFFDKGLKAKVLTAEDRICLLEFTCSTDPDAVLDEIAAIPLPPYIRRDGDAPPCNDRERYQTTYARHKGAVAAPTAGLHFTPELLDSIKAKGVEFVRITLHVGYGTFMPVRVDDVRKHKMHSEFYEISPDAALAINQAKDQGRRVVAVGTTSVRTLEYSSREEGRVVAGSGMCDLFIMPGFRFNIVDALITNFHLPQSTLLMLVSALAGRESILAAYKQAVENKYRFFSYGDAMFIE